MKVCLKIISVVLILSFMLFSVSCSSKNSKTAEKGALSSVSSVSSAAKTQSLASKLDEKVLTLDKSIPVKITNSAKYSGATYSMYIPDWKSIGELNHEKLQLNTRAFYNEDAKIYLFITEDLHENKYWCEGATNTYGDSPKATVSTFFPLSKAFFEYFLPEPHKDIFFAENHFRRMDDMMYGAYWDAEKSYSLNKAGDNFIIKNYIFTEPDHPVYITFFDYSDTGCYDDQIEVLLASVAQSFSMQ